MKDTRGFWMGDYWGSISIGYNKNLVKNPPKTFADLLKPEYKDQVALNGSPLTSGSAIAGVFAAATRERRLAQQRRARESTGSRSCKSVGNFIPVQTDAADGRVGPDADLDRLGLQQLRVREGVPGRRTGR